MTNTSHFNQVLELIDALPQDEQQDLINIVRQRQIERRREEIAENITQARQEYDEGTVFRGSVSDVLFELNQ